MILELTYNLFLVKVIVVAYDNNKKAILIPQSH